MKITTCGNNIYCCVPDFEPVIATVAYLIDKNPRCQFWTTYQVRRYWGVHCYHIYL